MKLTPIEELAEQVEITVLTQSYKNQLEQLRQAIISDFVNGLETDYIQLIDIDGHEHDNLFDLLEWRNK